MGRLQMFYVIKSLCLLAQKTDVEIRKIELPYGSDLAFLAEDGRGLIKTLDNIAANPANWEFVLDTRALKQIDSFKDLLLKTRSNQKERELSEKKRNPISPKMVQRFKEKVVNSYYDGAVLRDIFTNYLQEYVDQTQQKVPSEKIRFGITEVSDKIPFFDESDSDYENFGNSWGSGLAAGENSHLIDDIAKNCEEIAKAEFDATVSELIMRADVVIFTTDPEFWEFLIASSSFEQKNIDLLKGRLGREFEFKGKLIQVFLIRDNRPEEPILILNRAKIGKLVQLPPLNAGENPEFVKDIFYINVQAFSENAERLADCIQNPPDWLQKVGDEQKQREHLLELVYVQIRERFEYIKPDDFEGYKLFWDG